MSTQSIVKKGLVLAVGAGALVVAGASDASALELTNRFESGSSHSSTVTKVSGTRMVKTDGYVKSTDIISGYKDGLYKYVETHAYEGFWTQENLKIDSTSHTTTKSSFHEVGFRTSY